MFKYLAFFTCLLLPSLSSFACGFALDLVACWSPGWDPCSGCSGPASLSDCALTRHPAPHGKFISLKSWHFLTFLVGSSQQKELSPSPPLRPKHNGLQKRSGDLEGSCLTCGDARCLQQADLSHLAMKHCLNVDCEASCSKKQLLSQG